MSDDAEPITSASSLGGRRPLSRRAVLGGLGVIAAAGATTAYGPVEAASAAPTVTKIKNLLGTQTPVQFGIGATDLGVPARCPDGRTLYVFGDTWADHVGGSNWRSPVALWSSTTDLAAGVTFDAAVGGEVAQQLWYYPHDEYFTTVIPSDVVTIDGTMYLHAIVNGPEFGMVRWTEVWRSDDSGASWQHTGLNLPADKDGGHFQCLTWGRGDDGYVYAFGTGFQRDKGIVLNRIRETELGNAAAYEPWVWDGTRWRWGAPDERAGVILDGAWGEMCLRPVDGAWLFTGFNARDYRVDAKILATPTDNLYTAPTTTLIHGTQWGQEDDTHVAQLYGPYIIPGSTLSDLHLTLSQWNTTTNEVYHSMQFRVQGLA
ncbi:DUF4185 domain-containing protein [Georgenia deserti]|uniref:DUF4185 domain-containing protein n=1 Tax=Georgenia deserti TaxID=2093781 RepID=A0ABW4L807_9MICO